MENKRIDDIRPPKSESTIAVFYNEKIRPNFTRKNAIIAVVAIGLTAGVLFGIDKYKHRNDGNTHNDNNTEAYDPCAGDWSEDSAVLGKEGGWGKKTEEIATATNEEQAHKAFEKTLGVTYKHVPEELRQINIALDKVSGEKTDPNFKTGEIFDKDKRVTELGRKMCQHALDTSRKISIKPLSGKMTVSSSQIIGGINGKIFWPTTGKSVGSETSNKAIVLGKNEFTIEEECDNLGRPLETKTPPPFDACNNIAGIQPKVPNNFTEKDGVCTEEKKKKEKTIDVCSNIDGNQKNVPSGYTEVDGKCLKKKDASQSSANTVVPGSAANTGLGQFEGNNIPKCKDGEELNKDKTKCEKVTAPKTLPNEGGAGLN
ncbi:MAG: hypothetical protein WCH58_00430 [Candidatus Saccharibacteria bacterium]